jgi:hypothetical protein
MPNLQAARLRAEHLNARLTKDGWFVSDDGSRPYYHAVEAGFPIVSLVYYLGIESEPERARQVRKYDTRGPRSPARAR